MLDVRKVGKAPMAQWQSDDRVIDGDEKLEDVSVCRVEGGETVI